MIQTTRREMRWTPLMEGASSLRLGQREGRYLTSIFAEVQAGVQAGAYPGVQANSSSP